MSPDWLRRKLPDPRFEATPNGEGGFMRGANAESIVLKNDSQFMIAEIRGEIICRDEKGVELARVAATVDGALLPRARAKVTIRATEITRHASSSESEFIVTGVTVLDRED